MRWLTTAVLAVLLVGLAHLLLRLRDPAGARAREGRLGQGPPLEGARGEGRRGDRRPEGRRRDAPPEEDRRRLEPGRARSRPSADRARGRRPGDVAGDAPGRAGDRGQPPEAGRLRARAARRRGDLQGQGPGAHRQARARRARAGSGPTRRRRAKPAVILVPEGILTDAQKPPSEFRDRTLLAFERKDVKTVEVRGPAGQVVAAAGVKGADEWQLTAPLTAPADREAITGLLEKLRAAKIKEFVTDAPKSPAEYGLDRPTRITLGVGEEASRTARTLRFGKAVPEKKGVYAQREGDSDGAPRRRGARKVGPRLGDGAPGQDGLRLRPREARARRAREPQGEGGARPPGRASGASPRRWRSGPTRAR